MCNTEMRRFDFLLISPFPVPQSSLVSNIVYGMSRRIRRSYGSEEHNSEGPRGPHHCPYRFARGYTAPYCDAQPAQLALHGFATGARESGRLLLQIAPKKFDHDGKLVAPLTGRLPGQRMDWFPRVTGGNKSGWPGNGDTRGEGCGGRRQVCVILAVPPFPDKNACFGYASCCSTAPLLWCAP